MNPRDLAVMDDFRRAAEVKLEREKSWQFYDQQRRNQEDAKQDKDKRDEDFIQFFAQVALASPDAIAEFTVKLDTYDTATIEALMENEVELQAVRERIEEMLLEAHTLPDGRKVFKTRDGTKVFDASGAEIDLSEITPEEIDNKRPSWEDYQAERLLESRLLEERSELLEYQEKLDHARDRLDDPELTEDELSALDAELGEAMPDRVAKKLGLAADQNAPAQEQETQLVQTQVVGATVLAPPPM